MYDHKKVKSKYPGLTQDSATKRLRTSRTQPP